MYIYFFFLPYVLLYKSKNLRQNLGFEKWGEDRLIHEMVKNNNKNKSHMIDE